MSQEHNEVRTPSDLVSFAKTVVGTCSPSEARQRLEKDRAAVLLDVREAAEHEKSHVPGALNIPRGVIEWKIANVSHDPAKPILVHCATGGRAVLAAKSLSDIGYTNVIAIDGSYADIENSFTK